MQRRCRQQAVRDNAYPSAAEAARVDQLFARAAATVAGAALSGRSYVRAGN